MIKKKTLTVAITTTLAASNFVLAQSVQEQSPQKVERVEITGSNIKRIDAEGPLPVVILKRDDIERSGKTTVNELLSTLTVVSGGSFSETTLAGNSFAPGTAAVSLRGLGANTTLVLLNGRRVANYGFAQNVNESFVDLNSIPVTAIERVEVLKDGASAIYGSDAIAGVINVILRKDFRGVELSTSYGDSKDGGGGETRAALTAGTGDLARDRFNAMVMIDYYKREKINSQQRHFSRSADQRGNGPAALDFRSSAGNPGYWSGGAGNANAAFSTCPSSSVVPSSSLGVGGGGTVCAYDFAPMNDLVPESERVGGFATARYQMSPNWTLFAEGLINKNTTIRNSAPTPAGFSAVGHPDRPAGSTFTNVTYRFIEAGPRIENIDTESTRFVAGARGNVASWDVEAAANFAKSRTVATGRNYIIQERAAEAFAGTLSGFTGIRYSVLNPSGNPAGMLNAIKISPVRTGDSRVNGGDVKASRELFEMGGGLAALAMGYEYRKEKVADSPDPRVALSNPARVTVSGSGATGVNGGRNLHSAYAEVSLPFLKGFESQVALRMDRYSDFGTATTPKISLSWRPNNAFLMRSGYAEGFRAPSLAELYLSESTSFPTVVDTPRCRDYQAGLGATEPRTVAVCGSSGNGVATQIRSIFLGNPQLNAEESKSFSLGIVVEPTRSFSLSVDYYNVEHDNRIFVPTATTVVANEALYPGAVIRGTRSADDIAANARAGLRGTSGDEVAGVTRTYVNATQQRTDGLDIDLRNTWSLGEMGKLEVSNAYTYIISLKRQAIVGQPLIELVGTWEFPRWRHTLGLAWSRGSWATTVSANTIAGYAQFRTVGAQPVRLGNMLTYDAQVRYTGFKNLTLSLGGLNVTNNKPPFSNEGWYGYEAGVHNPRGAYFYGNVRYKF
jgi:iron complex outermembrane recepter protein